MDQPSYHDLVIRYIYIPLAAATGAITALASSKAQKTSFIDKLSAFVVSFSFAIFVTPWIAVGWLGIAKTDTQALAGLTYVFGSGSNIILPVLIEWLRRMVGAGKDAA